MFVDRPIGIDLGTTNSEVALLDPSETDLIVYADRFGRRTVPSAVCWDPKREVFLVGRAARNRRGRAPAPVESIKRKMGRDVTVPLGPHDLSPEEVSAEILGELVARMREHLVERSGDVDVSVARAVITVPAYFDAPQIEATRRAGELAGLEVLGLLQEPTAAAIYHTWRRQLGDGCFLVYDLGGGTFDVSILRCLAGEYQVLAIDGDNYLGGDDFDRRYAEALRAQLVERGYQLELDPLNDAEDGRRFLALVHLAQEIKESLSTADVVLLSKQALLEDQAGESVDFEGEVGRDDWEAIVGGLVETTIECCLRALQQSGETAGVRLQDIDHVVLVGGSTRVPLVIRRVTEALCAPSKSDAPLQEEVDTCVALGAAVHAAQLGGLRVGDGRATLCFRTPLVGKSSTLDLRVDVETAPGGAAELVVVEGQLDDAAEAGEVLAEAPIVSGSVRLNVPLGDAPGNPVTAELRREDGGVLCRLPFVLYRGDVRPRASSLSQPTVVAKDIALEVLRAGRRERKVLLSRGTGLPAEATHTFFTGDKSGAVVLRLLQNRLPIKTLMVTIAEDVPVGSPVELTLQCDEAMRLDARATVAGQELWASIEPAPQKTPGAAEVEHLLAQAEQIQKTLWGHDGHHFRHLVEPLATGIREVLTTDIDKLAALCAKLEQLLETFGNTEGGLTPPIHRFEGTLDALRRRVYRTEGQLLGMDRSEWDRRIDALYERGHDAWQRADAHAWRRVYNEAQALQETASEQEFSQRKLDDPKYVRGRLLGARGYATRLRHALDDFVPSSNEEVRQLQIRERDRLEELLETKCFAELASLSTDTEVSIAAARRKLDAILSDLNRIDGALEKLPSLGLVTERGR